MDKLTVRDIDVCGKRVLSRVDFNVPLDERSGTISDDSRIKAVLPTLNYLVEHGAKVILCSHLGRPDGKVVESLRLGVVGERLSQLLGSPVMTTDDCIGAEVQRVTENLKEGEIILLENLRFYADEETNDPDFARSLASLADIYVDDAFGTAHRKHASVVGVTEYLPSVAGFLMEKELTNLGEVIDNPVRPFGGIFGGLKVSDKLDMLENIIPRVDYALIGGCMATTFLKAKSYEVGLSIYEENKVDTAIELMEQATSSGTRLLLPDDVTITHEIHLEDKATIVPVENIPPDQMIVDIGPRTVEKFCEILRDCKTIFWNGPQGVNEIPLFAHGTLSIAEFLAECEATTVIGGGSTSEVVTKLGLADKMTFVSTGGGASLKFLSGQKLPGVEALLDKTSIASLKNPG